MVPKFDDAGSAPNSEDDWVPAKLQTLTNNAVPDDDWVNVAAAVAVVPFAGDTDMFSICAFVVFRKRNDISGDADDSSDDGGGDWVSSPRPSVSVVVPALSFARPAEDNVIVPYERNCGTTGIKRSRTGARKRRTHSMQKGTQPVSDPLQPVSITMSMSMHFVTRIRDHPRQLLVACACIS